MKWKPCLGLFYFIPFYAFSQGALSSNIFTGIGADASSLAVANAVTAKVNDVTASYYNPAGLINDTNKFGFIFSHDDYLADIASIDYLATSKRLDSNNAVALSFVRYGVDDIPNSISLITVNGDVTYNNISSTTAAYYCFLGSYAHKSKAIPFLEMGGSIKVLRQYIGTSASAWGFSLDGGVQYSYNQWHVGVLVRDLSSGINFWTYHLSDEEKQFITETGNVVPSNRTDFTPPEVVLGMERNFKLCNKNISLTPEFDITIAFNSNVNKMLNGGTVSMEPQMGIETEYKDKLFLRLGLGNTQQITDETNSSQPFFEPAFGIGIKIKSFSIDYALTAIALQQLLIIQMGFQ